MNELIITKEIYDIIYNEVSRFNEETGYEHDVEFGDVVYSFIRSTDDQLFVTNDWDEGEPNDPYWDKINNRHSTDSFFIHMNELLKTKSPKIVLERT